MTERAQCEVKESAVPVLVFTPAQVGCAVMTCPDTHPVEKVSTWLMVCESATTAPALLTTTGIPPWVGVNGCLDRPGFY